MAQVSVASRRCMFTPLLRVRRLILLLSCVCWASDGRRSHANGGHSASKQIAVALIGPDGKLPMTTRKSVATFLLSHDPALAFLTPKVSPNTDWNVLRARESKTGTDVLLVATMHCNPVSIELARETVFQEGNAGRLHAVAIEQCPTRWKAAEVMGLRDAGSWKRQLTDCEFYSSADAAKSFGVDLVFADLEVSDTFKRADEFIELTFKQLFTPWSDAGGWDRIAEDFRRVVADSRGPGLLFNPQVLAYSPVTFFRYPLGTIARTRGLKMVQKEGKGQEELESIGKAFVAFLFGPSLVVLLLGVLVTAGAIGDPLDNPSILTYVLGSGLLVWYVIFTRVLFVFFGEERNDVIAQNIRNACLDAKPGSSVVAVLGAAHCDGVAQLLREPRTP